MSVTKMCQGRRASPFTLRKAKATDTHDLFALEARVFGETGYTELALRQLLDLHAHTSLVATWRTGELVGYNLAGLAAGSKSAWILALAVDSQYRRHGVAQAMARAALDLLRQVGAHSARLTAHQDNEAALALYVSLGFRQVGWDEEYFGPAEPRLVLKRVLIDDAHSAGAR